MVPTQHFGCLTTGLFIELNNVYVERMLGTQI